MFQVQQRIAVLTKSRAKLLAELHELDRLREQVRKAERLGACAGEFQQPPSKDPQNCGDPGPTGFEFSEDVVARLDENSGITLQSMDGD
jgi:hypothetical protein